MAAILRSTRFVLRPFRKGDEESLRKNINDKDVSRFTITIPYPYKMKNAREWVRSCLAEGSKKKKVEVRFAIDKAGEIIGGITLLHIDGNKAELGYWLARSYWRQGIMTNASNLVCAFGFKQLKLQRIYATVLPENKASIRVLEKAGFKFDGRLRKLHKRGRRLLDALIYARVK